MLGKDGDGEAPGLQATADAKGFIESRVRVSDLHDADISDALAADPSAKSLDKIVSCFHGVFSL